MRKLYFKLVAKMASRTNLIVLGVLWILVEFLVRPSAEQEISKWSKGEGALDLTLIVSPQLITEKISGYGIEGRRIYSFVISTMETASTMLFFLFFSTLFFMLVAPFRNWWEAQWWKITLSALFLDIVSNCLLIHLLSLCPEPTNYSVCFFVVINGCNHIAHWVVWLLTAILLFHEAKRAVEDLVRKTS